jgi:hypothetical protein
MPGCRRKPCYEQRVVRSKRLLYVALVAAVVWVAALVILVNADWTLTCTVRGHPLGGIDCLQTNTVPAASSGPASWFGFVPLALTWLCASAVVLTCAVLGWRSRRAGGSVTA